MQELLYNYKKLNNSYKKEYIFHIGAEAGFYSELSNMVSAILFCLKYEYKFVLYSKDANFGYKKGWEDFFLPFTKETKFFIHHLYNKRTHKPKVRIRHRLLLKAYRFLFPNTYFTYELWDQFFCEKFDFETFDIPQLGIKGDLREASSVIAKMIYRFNAKTESEIKLLKNSLNLPVDYVAMQIRRGDKITEWSLLPIDEYFNKAEEVSDIREVFVLTDDYSVIKEIELNFSCWRAFTLTSITETGYVNEEFNRLSNEERYNRLVKLFTSVDIIISSSLYIGNYTTNLALFVGMIKLENEIRCVQKSNWFRFLGV